MATTITKVIAIVLLSCCGTTLSAEKKSVVGKSLSLELIQRENGVVVLLSNIESGRQEIEYPFELLYGEAKSGLEIYFFLSGHSHERRRMNLCPNIDMGADQLPKKALLLPGNVVGQRFTKNQLRELYCLEKKKYEMTARFHYRSGDGTQKDVHTSATVDFSE